MPRSEINNNPLSSMDIGGVPNLEEKRAKREIANMNERRRMQNINAGFHSLRNMLPDKHMGEKLSKAAILQHTATYIAQLEDELRRISRQNDALRNMAGESATAVSSICNQTTPDWVKRLQNQPPDCPKCKRRKYANHSRDIDSSPINGDGSSTESSSEQEMNSKYNNRSKNNKQNARLSNDPTALRKQLSRIEKELEEERRLRLSMEEEYHYHGKSMNGRQYLQPSVDHEEVEIASESIEIEMQSCPASPPEMVITSTEHVTTANAFPSSQYQRIDLVEQHHRLQKQNAIALPIDVPFVAPHDSPTEIQSGTATNATNGPVLVVVDSNYDQNLMLVEGGKISTTTATSSSSKNASSSNGNSAITTAPILQLVPNNSSSKGPTILTAKASQLLVTGKNTETGDQAKTSRQNLNTIVQAIRHLEGDFMFNETVIKEEIRDSDACLLKATNGGTAAAKTIETNNNNNNDSNDSKSNHNNINNNNNNNTETLNETKANKIITITNNNHTNNNSNQEDRKSTIVSPTAANIVVSGNNNDDDDNNNNDNNNNNNNLNTKINSTTINDSNDSIAASSQRPQIIQRPNVIVTNVEN